MQIRQTEVFSGWLSALRDRAAKARIEMRLRRAELGNLGDIKSLGGGLSEMRIDHGPGYRLYLTQRQNVAIILLCGGDKDSQARDIVQARALAKALGEGA